MTIGERIKERRTELGMSISELAKKLGKDRSTVYRYESDFIKDLPLRVLIPLAEALNTTPADLMVYDSEEEAIEAMHSSLKEEVVDDLGAAFDEDVVDIIRVFVSLNKDNMKKAGNYINKLRTLQDLEDDNEILIAAHADDSATAEQLQSDAEMLKKGDERN